MHAIKKKLIAEKDIFSLVYTCSRSIKMVWIWKEFIGLYKYYNFGNSIWSLTCFMKYLSVTPLALLALIFFFFFYLQKYMYLQNQYWYYRVHVISLMFDVVVWTMNEVLNQSWMEGKSEHPPVSMIIWKYYK